MAQCWDEVNNFQIYLVKLCVSRSNYPIMHLNSMVRSAILGQLVSGSWSTSSEFLEVGLAFSTQKRHSYLVPSDIGMGLQSYYLVLSHQQLLYNNSDLLHCSVMKPARHSIVVEHSFVGSPWDPIKLYESISASLFWPIGVH